MPNLQSVCPSMFTIDDNNHHRLVYLHRELTNGFVSATPRWTRPANRLSVGELFVGFMKYYADFPFVLLSISHCGRRFDTQMITVRAGKPQSRIDLNVPATDRVPIFVQGTPTFNTYCLLQSRSHCRTRPTRHTVASTSSATSGARSRARGRC